MVQFICTQCRHQWSAVDTKAKITWTCPKCRSTYLDVNAHGQPENEMGTIT